MSAGLESGLRWGGSCSWRLALLILVWVLELPGWGHVGTPFVVFEGKAGRYDVRAVIRQPEVVPGLAEIQVRVEPQPGVQSAKKVRVLPLHATTDRSGAPRADEAVLVDGETNLYRAELWFMARGAYGVEISVEGDRVGAGSVDAGGSVMIPVNSLATARKPMPSWLGWVLAGLGLVLGIGVVLIAAGAVREGTLAAGVHPDSKQTQTALLTGVAALVLVVLAVYWGGRWWGYEENIHASRVVFRPFEHQLKLEREGSRWILELQLTDSRATNRNYNLIQDHGKWVHLFLVGEESLPTLVHVHPVRGAGQKFRAALPRLREGRYRVFAELTHETGLSQTLTNTLVIKSDPGVISAEEDFVKTDTSDSWLMGGLGEEGREKGLECGLDGGRMMRLEVKHGVRGEPAVLSARVTDAEARPVTLQPYLRMMGHAAVMREDGEVFLHLHPAGTLNMAAARKHSQKMDGDEAGKKTDLVCGDLDSMPPESVKEWARTGEVRFPLVFPKPGRYWVWVQVRVEGKVETGRFLVHEI